MSLDTVLVECPKLEKQTFYFLGLFLLSNMSACVGRHHLQVDIFY